MTDDEVSDARHAHVRAVTITVLAALAGVFSAVLSGVLTGDLIAAGEYGEAATDIGAIAVLILAIMIQIPLYPLLGFDDFGGGKDVLYVAFMTFALWFITYGVILTTGLTFL